MLIFPTDDDNNNNNKKKEKKITNWTNLLVLGSSGCKSLWPFVIHPDLSQCIITSKGNFICLCLLVV